MQSEPSLSTVSRCGRMFRRVIRSRSGSNFTHTSVQIIDFALQVITHAVYICLRALRVSKRPVI
jgi:hypothetical protein